MEDLSEIILGICSDTHSQAFPEWPSGSITAVLHAGDVYDAPSLIDDEDDPRTRSWIESIKVPVLAVRGNHDFRDPGGFFKVAEDITGRLHRLGPRLWVAGVGFAAQRYYDLPGESDLAPQCSDLARRATRDVMPKDKLILVTHYPPKLPELPCDDVPAEWTFHCVAELIKQLRPTLVVQGHVHEWFGRQWRSGDSRIISPGAQSRILAL